MRLKSTFINERNVDLIRAYRLALASPDITTQKQAMKKAINTPSLRFWITPECATKMVNRIRRGDPLLEIKPHRRQMFFEIYQRYNTLKNTKQHREKSVSYICSFIVEEPAPAFYLTVATAIKLYEQHQNKNRCRK